MIKIKIDKKTTEVEMRGTMGGLVNNALNFAKHINEKNNKETNILMSQLLMCGLPILIKRKEAQKIFDTFYDAWDASSDSKEATASLSVKVISGNNAAKVLRQSEKEIDKIIEGGKKND